MAAFELGSRKSRLCSQITSSLQFPISLLHGAACHLLTVVLHLPCTGHKQPDLPGTSKQAFLSGSSFTVKNNKMITLPPSFTSTCLGSASHCGIQKVISLSWAFQDPSAPRSGSAAPRVCTASSPWLLLSLLLQLNNCEKKKNIFPFFHYIIFFLHTKFLQSLYCSYIFICTKYTHSFFYFLSKQCSVFLVYQYTQRADCSKTTPPSALVSPSWEDTFLIPQLWPLPLQARSSEMGLVLAIAGSQLSEIWWSSVLQSEPRLRWWK